MFFESDHWIILSLADQNWIEAKIEEKILHNKKHKRGYSSDRNKQIVELPTAIRCGYRSEYALSRYAGLKWSNETPDNYHKPDLEFGVEVKASDNPKANLFCSQKHLEQYLRQGRDTPLVCVITAFWPIVEFHGFMFAKEIGGFPFTSPDGRHNAGFLVPRQKLRPMSEFAGLIEYWKNCFATSEV